MPLDSASVELLRQLTRQGLSINAIGTHLRQMGVSVSSAPLRAAVSMVRRGQPVTAALSQIPVRQLPSPRQVTGGFAEMLSPYEYSVRFDFVRPGQPDITNSYVTIRSDSPMAISDVLEAAEQLVEQRQDENEEAYGDGDVGYINGTGELALLRVRTDVGRGQLRD